VKNTRTRTKRQAEPAEQRDIAPEAKPPELPGTGTNVALEAAPLTVGSPEIGSPAFGQGHALQAAPATVGSPEIGVPLLLEWVPSSLSPGNVPDEWAQLADVYLKQDLDADTAASDLQRWLAAGRIESIALRDAGKADKPEWRECRLPRAFWRAVRLRPFGESARYLRLTSVGSNAKQIGTGWWILLRRASVEALRKGAGKSPRKARETLRDLFREVLHELWPSEFPTEEELPSRELVKQAKAFLKQHPRTKHLKTRIDRMRKTILRAVGREE
jgi:hypothetical protein